MDFDIKLKQAKVRVLLFMMENETMNLNNEAFIVKFREIYWNTEIPSETITRSRRYRKSKQYFFSWKDNSEAEYEYRKNFKV